LDRLGTRLPLEGGQGGGGVGEKPVSGDPAFAGWYMVNVLDLPSEDVAIALGHTDGGELVRRLYGHRDHDGRSIELPLPTSGRRASRRCSSASTLE
jgi:hypothetical protein